MKRKQPSPEEVHEALCIADSKAKHSIRYSNERKRQQQEKARKRYQEASEETKRERNAKCNKQHKTKYDHLKQKFDNAKKKQK